MAALACASSGCGVAQAVPLDQSGDCTCNRAAFMHHDHLQHLRDLASCTSTACLAAADRRLWNLLGTWVCLAAFGFLAKRHPKPFSPTHVHLKREHREAHGQNLEQTYTLTACS